MFLFHSCKSNIWLYIFEELFRLILLIKRLEVIPHCLLKDFFLGTAFYSSMMNKSRVRIFVSFFYIQFCNGKYLKDSGNVGNFVSWITCGLSENFSCEACILAFFIIEIIPSQSNLLISFYRNIQTFKYSTFEKLLLGMLHVKINLNVKVCYFIETINDTRGVFVKFYMF